MPFGVISRIVVGDQLHVVALQRARPDAVVAQQALGAGRVGRHHRARAGRAGRRTPSPRYPVSTMRTRSFAALDRRALRLPVGVDAHAFEHAVAHAPEDPEAVPLAVRRHVPVQPVQARRHAVVVVGGRTEPRRRALEHEQLADVGRDLGDELHRARAGADDRDALAREVDVVVPLRGVERRARERVAARRCPGTTGGSAGRPR